MMKSGVTKSASITLILFGVVISGCLDRISDKLDPEEEDPEEPHKRLQSIRGRYFVGGSCVKADTNIPNIVGPNCGDVVMMIGETKCDPPQLWVSDKDDPMNFDGVTYDSVEEARAAQAGVESPKDAYLHCEIVVDWLFNGRSLMPDSKFHVIHETGNRTFTETCQIPVQSQCGIEMSYVANLTVNKEKESEVHDEWGEVEIEWFEPTLHLYTQSVLKFDSEFFLVVQ